MIQFCDEVKQAIQQNKINETKQTFLPFLQMDDVPSESKAMFSS